MTVRTRKTDEIERRNVYVSMVDADLVGAFREKCEAGDLSPARVLARLMREWISKKEEK